MRHATFILLLLTGISCFAQKDKNRYTFAQTYVGFETDYLRAHDLSGAIPFPNGWESRVLIGGTHFWNRADFYISIPLLSGDFEDSDLDYSNGVITGARVLPFGHSAKGPRPWLGAQWMVRSFQYGEGPTVEQHRLGLEGGLAVVFSGSWTLEGGVRYVNEGKVNYYTGRNEQQQLALPRFTYSLGVKRYFDFTASLQRPEAQEYFYHLEEQMRSQGRLNTWSVAAGVSSTIPLGEIPYAKDYPFVDPVPQIAIHPDLALGYFFHRPNLALRLAFRPFKLRQEAHGLQLAHRQNHFSVEAFKFLFDYKGFVPFAGLSADLVDYDFTARDGETLLAQKQETVLSPAIVFGWDIRPSDAEWFILRTNLRYIPSPGLSADGKDISGPQLEVNFIQFVLYPSRLKFHFN